jgi:hypothetical protein
MQDSIKRLPIVQLNPIEILFFGVFLNCASPALAGYSVNGTHRCEQGGTMRISGYNGRVSAPTVYFRGVTYTMRPYTPPGATYESFVADNQSGIELGVGKWLSITNDNGSVCTSKDWHP